MLRVSSNGQLDGYGPEVQRTDIRKWAKAAGHKIVTERLDAVTGASGALERPGLLDAIRMVRAGEADGIVVGKLDRLARQLTIQEAILALVWSHGGRVFTADQGEVLQDDPDDPMRTAIRQVQGVFAELDRRTLVKRMRDGRKAKAAEGKHSVGQYAYGYAGAGTGRDRDAAPHEPEQAAVRRIVALRAEGASYRAIAAALDTEGLRPRYAERWSPAAVRNVAIREGCA